VTRPMPSAADRIVAWLRTSTAPVSGEELAGRLGMSRAAVFKHIEALRARGYTIEASHAQGYRLTATPDRLDETELAPHLSGSWRRVEWHARLDSTQRRARELARDGAPEGTVVVAEEQTAGRGRLGRTWHSPAGCNVYCSLVLRPALSPLVVPQLALVLGLGSARAIRAASGLEARLKWPNDVLVGGRKVVGILTEMEAELERVELVLAGIGVNVNGTIEDFPAELRDKVTSLAVAAGRPIDRVAFMARLLDQLEATYRAFLAHGFAGLRSEWEEWSALGGRRVTVRTADGDRTGRVVGLDDDGALRLTDDAGALHRVVAGDVTLADGYA